MSDNPYDPNGLATGEGQFFGRGKEVEQIIADLSSSSSHPYFVVGGRRSGKTSLLSELSRRAREANTKPGVRTKLLPVYLNLKEYSPQSEKDFFEVCMKGLNDALQSQTISRGRCDLRHTTWHFPRTTTR